MTTPKEALERARSYVKPSHAGDVQADADLRAIDEALASLDASIAGAWRCEIKYGPEGEANYAWVYDAAGDMVCTAKTHHAEAIVTRMNATASLQGEDAVERVARIIDPDAFSTNYMSRDEDWQPDDDKPKQMRARDKARAILATGLVPDEAAIRADWHTTGWDRARNSGRILLVWREFAGVREHVELGRYSDSKTAWVNTYGRPFHANPDGWAPLLPFKTAETVRANEREKCAKIAEDNERQDEWPLHGSEMQAPSRRMQIAIAAAIRSGGGE